MGDDEGGRRALQDERQEFLAQLCREGGIERDERLVEEEKIGLDRERACDSDTPGETERQFPWKMIEMLRKTQRRDDLGEIVLA